MRVSRDQLEKVIHRAAELQFGRGDTPDVLEAEEVLRIAEEVGLEGRFVRQALAEVRADALIPARPPDDSTATRLWGEAIIVAARVVPGEPGSLQARLARYLAERESLRCVRDRPGQLVFEPAEGVMSQIQRALDFGGHGYDLAKARSIGVMVQPLEEGRSLVSITADMSNQRTGHAAGWYGGLGSFGMVSALGAILGGGAPALIVLPAVAAGVGLVGTFGTSRTVAVQRRRLELAVQGLLDRLERGFDMPADRPSLRERITELLED
jgi:hypothetical protein